MIINTWNLNAEKKFRYSSFTKILTKSMSEAVIGKLK